MPLIAADHQQQMLDDELIGFRALYSTTPEADPGQIPGQLSLDDHTNQQMAADQPEPEAEA
jgi:putative transposase